VQEFLTEYKEFADNKEEFGALLLGPNELSQLFAVYCKIDIDRSGDITTWELLEHLHLERSRFTKRIFRIFDEDGSGQIDFREFVIACWNYCTLGKPALIMFAFDL
jgi:serine/threonine-protein phosphatase 2B regulatory subunit